jgi:predicted transglutaminase-like cysteine proteinase
MDKSLLVLGLATAALLGTSPAAAAVAANSASPYAVSASAVRKSEALLGTSSRLAALMAEQGGTVLPAPASAPPLQQAVLRSPWSATPVKLERPAMVRGSPDVFGSTALPIDSTPLDRRWRNVAGRPADAGASRWAASLRNQPEAQRIEAINRFVNARIAFVDDSQQFGRNDVWQSASDALRRGRGDCEDYAITKLQLLRAAGLAERDLYLVIVKDLVRRSDHAVLAVHSGGRLLVLDNGTDKVTDSADISDYRPIFTYAAGNRWTHGYRRTNEAVMTLASVTRPADTVLPAPAAAPSLIDAPEPVFTVSAADLDPTLLV